MNLTRIKKSIEDVGTTLDPEEDWMPVLILEKSEEVMTVGLAGDCMLNQESKDITATLMTKIVQEAQPDSVAFISTAWGVLAKPEEDCDPETFSSGKMPIPSQHPDRVEIVICMCIGHTSESVMYGHILRSDSHPQIGKWEIIQDDGIHLGGRFAEALRNGFKKKGGEWKR